MDRVARAKEIIENIRYITLATTTLDGEPWNTPVFCAHDDKYNFYWTSWHGTQHSLNVAENPNVFIVIYDSTVPEGTGEGVYIKAKARMLTEKDDIEGGLRLMYARKNKATKPFDEFLGDRPRRVYKAVPEQVWVNFDAEMNGSHIDTRKEITLA